MSLRTPLARVRGLGSAKEGTDHWWMQRVTALALVPLSLWFVFFAISNVGADHAGLTATIAEPYNTVLLVMLLICVFYHAMLGLQVVIEDYVHREGLKIATMLLMKAVAVLFAATGIFAVLRIALVPAAGG